jgi:hypothetical protein
VVRANSSSQKRRDCSRGEREMASWREVGRVLELGVEEEEGESRGLLDSIWWGVSGGCG